MGLILLRYGELALKGGARPEFTKRLRRNLRACLKANGIAGEVNTKGSRLFVRTNEVERAIPALQRVFGVTSLSPVAEAAKDVEAMAAVAVRFALDSGLSPEKSFRVRANRADKSFPLTSPQIGRELGERVWDATHARIDLSENADLTIGVEVGPDKVLIYGQVLPGPGGFPIGTGGRVVALMSGGIDSPVAAWMMAKRGCTVIPLHFRHNDVEQAKFLDNCELLGRWSYGWDIRPVIEEQAAAFGPTFERLQALREERWTCVMCKRTLLKRAAEIADQYAAHAIVTGESLGQVASQTLLNMEAINYGMTKPILRPLIGLDKVEVMQIARRIGTYDISTREAQGCTYVPRHPITTAKLENLVALLDDLAGESKA